MTLSRGCRSWATAACAGVLLAIGCAGTAASAAELQPTATCPAEAITELRQTIDFVRGQTWTQRPHGIAINISPDLNTCKVVLNVGELSNDEESALQAGAGSRLAIEHRKDWARPSRRLLMLWVVFGGSGLVWVFRRYARQ